MSVNLRPACPHSKLEDSKDYIEALSQNREQEREARHGSTQPTANTERTEGEQTQAIPEAHRPVGSVGDLQGQ